MIKSCKQFAIGIYKALNNLIQTLKRPDILTVEALCIRFTGDTNGGRMLYRLLYWWSKSVKESEEVYKSHRDWNGELCLSREQSGRVHREEILERVGVIRRQRQTAKGNPVHYLLDVDTFLARLAEFANMTVEQLLDILDGKGLTADTDSACVESPQVTTESPTIKNFYNSNDINNNSNRTSNETDVVVDTKLLSIPNMKTPVLIQLIRIYGLERVQAIYEYAKRQDARNIGGFVRKGLVEDWEIMDVPPQKSNFEGDWTDYAAPYDPNAYISGEYADFINDARDFATPDPIPQAPPNSNLETVISQGEGGSKWTAKSVWSAICQQMDLQLPRNFANDLRNAKLVDYLDGVFVVEVASAHARGMLEYRVYPNFKRLLQDLCQNAVTVRFEYHTMPEPKKLSFLDYSTKENMEGLYTGQ